MNIEELCQKLKPYLGEKIEKLYLQYRLTSDFKARQRIEQTILLLYNKHFNSLLSKMTVNLVPPYPEQSWGKYEIGSVLYNNEVKGMFGLYDEEITRHIGIFGITGTGKSNTTYKLVLSLLEKGKRVLIFDWKKQYRSLLTIKPRPNIDIFGFGNHNIPSFTFNPLIPPKGISIPQYIEQLSEIIAQSYFCGEGVISILRSTLKDLYQEIETPTFTNLLDRLYQKKFTGRMKDWLSSTIRSIEAICHGGLGEMVNVKKPVLDIKKLLQRNVILELAELGQSQKMFIIQSLLLQIYYHKINSGRSSSLKNVIVIEEAHHILLRKNYSDGEEPITDILLKEIREFGVGIVIIDQNPSMMSVPALANNFTTIGMYVKHGHDITALSKAMFLNPEQTGSLGRLKRGEAIVKLAGRCYYPFLIKVPLVPIRKTPVSDKDVALHMLFQGYWMKTDLFQASSSNSKKCRSYATKPSIKGSDTTDTSLNLPLSEKDDTTKFTFLSQDAQSYLEDIDAYPFDGVAIRSKRLGFTTRRKASACEELIRKGIIKQVDVKLCKGRIYLYEITNDGRSRCKEQGIKLKPIPKNHGGIIHRYWCHKTKQEYERKGYTVEKEYPDGNGGFIDLVATKRDKKIAIEVETGKSDVEKNKRRCERMNFYDVKILFVN